ncbi:MAG: type III pantothenate kinase [Lachnospiraceae bacterium]|nr:type III pantothenate kinase [Candidatus Equihabitans merdae]
MILAIDVGNTHSVFGCIEKGEILHQARLTTDKKRTTYEYAANMQDMLSFFGVDAGGFEGAIISSVVGPVTETLVQAVKLVTGVDTMVVGKGLKTGLDIRIDDPGTVGADLVVGAVAALKMCKPPVIMVDMGTAPTIFVLDAKGRFIGGAIAPGLGISMNALSGGTAALPQVALTAPEKCISTNTVTCMQSGAIYGSAAMIDGMIDRMEEELGQKATVVATGGLAGCVTPLCKHEIIWDDDMLLDGLYILWEKNNKSRKK